MAGAVGDRLRENSRRSWGQKFGESEKGGRKIFCPLTL